jgi:drug/metabolite transporter (DMT)-like permease
VTALRDIARVVLWMSGALLAFSALAIAIRVLGGMLGVMEILTLRAGVGLAIMAVLAAARPELRAGLRTRKPGLHLLRNTVHLAAQYFWASSLLLLPLATVFALEFTVPAWSLLLAVPVLGERMTASRISAVVLGLAGVLVILRPGIAAFQPAVLLVLIAAVGLASTLILTKKLTVTDSSFAIIFWMNVIQFPLALLISQPAFVLRLGAWDLPAVAAVGVSGLVSHYCLANAFRAGEAMVVAPLDFMRIPLIAVIGWWLYGEKLDAFVFIGAGLIISGILWNLRSEAKQHALARSPA